MRSVFTIEGETSVFARQYLGCIGLYTVQRAGTQFVKIIMSFGTQALFWN